MRVVGNGSIGEGNSALSIDAAALKGTVVSGDRHILDGYPSLRINAAPVAITCIPRGGRLVAGDRGVGDRNCAGVKVDIDAAAVAGGRRVVGDGSAVHGEAALLTHIYAAGAAACFITGNLSTIHGKGRAGLIGAALYTDLHAAGDRAAVQLKFAAIDEHSALNPAAAGAVGQRQRRAAADRDTAGNRLLVQAEVDLARWHSPAPRHRLRQVVVTSRSGQRIRRCPCYAIRVMFMAIDRRSTAADAVGMIGLRQRKRSQRRRLFSKTGREVCILRRADGTVQIHHLLTASVGADTGGFRCAFAGCQVCIFRRTDRTVGIDRPLLTVGFADALRRSIPGHTGNKPTVLGIALLAGIPTGRPLCGRNVAAGMGMLAAFMGTV